jgi:SAM-dependent methyltransferase
MESLIEDLAQLEAIADLSERGDDPTGNWIGGGRPRTNHEGPIGTVGTLAKAFARWSAIHYSFYAALIDADVVPNKSNLLAVDLGCAGGARTLQLSQKYGAVLGIDRSKKAIDFAMRWNEGARVAYRRDDWPCGIGKPDRIFAVEFFEHFAPSVQRDAIVAALDSLAPGGLLLMTIPNEAPQQKPHEGTLETEALDSLISGLGRAVFMRSWFDNEAPGDPCRSDWKPIGPRKSHHCAVLRK